MSVVGSMSQTDTLQLVLYVTDDTPRSVEAIANLKRVQKLYRGRCELTIIDILDHPELAEREKIFATPTLIKAYPPPLRRIVGDLSDQAQLLKSLDLGSGYLSAPSAQHGSGE